MTEEKTKLELIDLQWLLDHHKSKEQERRQMVNDLNIKPGDLILDLGCGPGLWTMLLAEKVKPNGKVIGVDGAPELLNFAIKNLKKEPLRELIEFKKADFADIPYRDDIFDLVFFGNCFAYVNNHSQILAEMKRVTKPGGRIAAKDFDGGVFIVHPIDPDLTMKIMAAAARALKENPLEPIFDNFSGRKMHGLFSKEQLKDINTTSYAIQKVQPLTPEIKKYITGNAEWLIKIGHQYLLEEDINQWRSHFDPNSDKYILDLEEFYFCMLEIMTIGTV